MRVRTVFSARSIASALSEAAIFCLESSTSRARYMPPWRSRPLRSGTRRSVTSRRMPSEPRTRVVSSRGNSDQMDTRQSATMVRMRYFRGIRLREGGRSRDAELSGTYKVNWRLGLGQRNSRLAGVPAELGNERVEVGEAGRVAQASNDLDRHGPPIPIATRVKKMSLDGAVHFAKRRPAAEIHHSAERTKRSVCAHGVYTVRRQKLSRRAELHVERRVAEIAATLASGHDHPMQRVGPPECLSRAREVPVGDRVADRARRHGHAGGVEQRPHPVHAETIRPPESGQQLGVAMPAPPESVVVADDELAEMVPLDEDVEHERFRAEACQIERERQHGDEQRAAVGQRLELFLARTQQH